MSKSIVAILVLWLIMPGGASASSECSHDQYGHNCSDRNGHSRQRSKWGGGYEHHNKAQSSYHDRERSDWRAHKEPVHSRANSQRDQ